MLYTHHLCEAPSTHEPLLAQPTPKVNFNGITFTSYRPQYRCRRHYFRFRIISRYRVRLLETANESIAIAFINSL